DYSIPISPASPAPISAPTLGSLTTGQLTRAGGGPSIGAPDGDPDASAIYGQPGLTGAQRTQYATENLSDPSAMPRGQPAPLPPRGPIGEGEYLPLEWRQNQQYETSRSQYP